MKLVIQRVKNADVSVDNKIVGVTAGTMTPLDFNSVFPVNTVVGLKLGKEITPVVGFEAEGLASFNDNHFGDFKTGIKATNLGGALTLNISNLFAGYNGKPRPIEFKTNTGIGWLHTYGDVSNALTAKTALDVVWNIGNSTGHLTDRYTCTASGTERPAFLHGFRYRKICKMCACTRSSAYC